MEYEFHDLANDYSLMPESELEYLADDMMRTGYDARFPIVLYEGKILDGRNRYRAANLAFVDPVFVELPPDEDAARFVRRANEHRRHLEKEWLQKRRQERIARVAEARAQGQSLRVIAAKEGVGKSQVERDLEDAAAQVSPPGTPEAETAEPLAEQEVAETNERAYTEKNTEIDGQDDSLEKGGESASEGKVVGRDGKAYPQTSKSKGTKRSKKVEDQTDDEREGAPSKAVDHFGIPIQPHAAEVFAADGLFGELLAKLKECRKLYAHLAEQPGGVALLQASVSINAREQWKNRGIENAILSIEDARPYMTVCPYQYNVEHDHVEDCTLCRGRGWTTPFTKNRVPPDLIEAAKRAFDV